MGVGELMSNWCRGHCFMHSLPNYERCVLATFCDNQTKTASCGDCPEDKCGGMCHVHDGQCVDRPKRYTKRNCLCRWLGSRRAAGASAQAPVAILMVMTWVI